MTRLDATDPQLRADLRSVVRDWGGHLTELPYTGRLILANLLAQEKLETARHLMEVLLGSSEADLEVSLQATRLIMQDYTAVPMFVDLAALRDAVEDPESINPVLPVDIVVDHSIHADWTAEPTALARNESRELEQNSERFTFLKWAASVLDGVRVHPPGSGIVHQINLEQLITLVVGTDGRWLPETVFGTDSHTTMMNGLGVLGWGLGGMDAQSIMLGETVQFRMPPVVGVRLVGEMPGTAQASDLALEIAGQLRAADLGSVMVEFCGPGVRTLDVTDRCTVANMAPEFGVMSALFPTDEKVLDYLALTGRTQDAVETARVVLGQMGLLRDDAEPTFSSVIEIDLSTVNLRLAGPSRPDQTVLPAQLRQSFIEAHPSVGHSKLAVTGTNSDDVVPGAVAIAAITSCTNTSNPAAMITAGLVCRRAQSLGLSVPPWVKTSLSPGAPSVSHYLAESGLLKDFEHFGFHVTGYGCMTCNGGGGALDPAVQRRAVEDGVPVVSVLSGNRNFPGRVHEHTASAYLASPALVVALAIAGTVMLDLEQDPLGHDPAGRPVFLEDLWPSRAEVDGLLREFVTPDAMTTRRADLHGWDLIPTPEGVRFSWSADSTYLRAPSYVAPQAVPTVNHMRSAVPLLALGDDVSTDHISPVGMISRRSVAGQYLLAQGEVVLNSFGSRRGNHEVMARGAFSNPRLKNALAPSAPAGHTLHRPTGAIVSVYETAHMYRQSGTPLVILAGRRYGMGSSRDWAAKAPALLGVRAVLAESFESIHRANLCAMGIAPIVMPRPWRELGLTGTETLEIEMHPDSRDVRVTAADVTFTARLDIHTGRERRLLKQGGAFAAFLAERAT